MKKQYDYYECRWPSYYYECRWPSYEIVLYHDGIKIRNEYKNLLELDKYLEELEAEGYTRGYTEEDVEEARKKWEHIYENRIERNGWEEIK